MGRRHFSRNKTGGLVGHTYAIVILGGLIGAAGFDLFLLGVNLAIAYGASKSVTAGYSLAGVWPLYLFLGAVGFGWGAMLATEAYFPDR